jgi:hypothetical protein
MHAAVGIELHRVAKQAWRSDSQKINIIGTIDNQTRTFAVQPAEISNTSTWPPEDCNILTKQQLDSDRFEHTLDISIAFTPVAAYPTGSLANLADTFDRVKQQHLKQMLTIIPEPSNTVDTIECHTAVMSPRFKCSQLE